MYPETEALARKLRAERKYRRLTVEMLARAIRDNAPAGERDDLPKLLDLQRKIRDWEAAKWGPSERYQMLLCRALNMSEEALFGVFLRAQAEARPERAKSRLEAQAQARAARAKAKADAQAEAERAAAGQEPGEDKDEVERRQVLQALATLGVATASPVTDALHTIQGYVEKGLDRDTVAKMDDWDETVAEYGFSYLATPPARLIGELAADLVTVQTMKPYLDGAQRFRWFRVTAGLSWLMAKTLANIGDTRESRTWWATSQHAADSSGDADLSMWIAGERLIRGLYEERPSSVLLRQAATLIEVGGSRTNAGVLKARTVRAQLFAALRRPGDALEELRRAEDAFTELPASVTSEIGSDWSWCEDRLRYVATWVYAHLGKRDRLDVAANRTVRLLEEAGRPRAVAQVRLLQAAGYVRSGDVASGVAQAASTYEQCPPDQRTTLVAELAGGVWHAIPLARRKESAVEDYHGLLSLAAPLRRAIT